MTDLAERIRALLNRIVTDVAGEIIHDESLSCVSCNGPTDEHTEDCFVTEAKRLLDVLSKKALT